MRLLWLPLWILQRAGEGQSAAPHLLIRLIPQCQRGTLALHHLRWHIEEGKLLMGIVYGFSESDACALIGIARLEEPALASLQLA